MSVYEMGMFFLMYELLCEHIFFCYTKLLKFNELVLLLILLQKYSSHVQPLTLYHVQVTGWSKDSSLPAHLNTIVDLLRTVQKWRSGSKEDTPIVIHCR
jgi:protein tyrosine phosphatase